MVNFEEQKKRGLEFELRLCDYLRKYDPDPKVISGNECRFDIVCKNMKLTYEAKYDFRCNETGNFAIELEDDGEPSGLQTSEADVWVLYDGEYAYFIYREALLEIIKSGGFRTWVGRVEGKEMKKLLFLPKVKLECSPYVSIERL